MPEKADRQTRFLIAGALGLLLLLVFGRTLRQEFVDWDDTTAIVFNADYNPPAIERLGHYWTESYRNFYAPVLYTVWGVAAQFAYEEGPQPEPGRVAAQPWRLSAGPFHALNILAHLCGTLFAWAILGRLFSRSVPAIVGAAIFALHPLQAEPVAWASTLYTPLSAAFGLAAWWWLLVAIDRRDNSAQPREKWWNQYALATSFFLLSLLTKPSMVVLPLIVLFVETVLRSKPRRSLLRSTVLMVPWLGLSVASAVILSRFAQPALDVVRPSIPDRIMIAGDAIAFYLGKVAWPSGLTPDYGRTPSSVLAGDHPWLGLVVSVCVLAISFAFIRKNRAIAVGIGIFMAAGLPTLGLVPFDFQLYSTVADRYAYFSLFGIAILTAGIADKMTIATRGGAIPKAIQQVSMVGGGVVLLAMCFLTWRQIGFWRDSPTLFARALDMNPTSRVGLEGMLGWFNQRQQPAEAIVYGRRLLAHHPNDYRFYHYSAQVLMQLKQWDEAIGMLQKAEHLAREKSDKADAINAQGVAYAQSNRPVEAERCFRSSLLLNTDLHSAHRNLAALYLSQNRLPDALTEFESALRIDPQNPHYQNAVGQLSHDIQRHRQEPAPPPPR